jgi:sugar O-acyltransferase (sialic acid O-acetyltransferase NeuD family)
MTSPLFAIYGASGCGRSVMPVARQQLVVQGVDPDRLVFVDDALAEESINDHRVLAYDDFLNIRASDRLVAIAIADSEIREQLAAKCRCDQISAWTVRADNVVIMDDVEIGEGALLSPFVTITSNVRIGRFFHGNLYSYVEHDCWIGDFVTFAPGVKCNGNIVVEDHAYIGAGAILRQGKPGAPLRIGRGSVVGMGAVVTCDVAAGVTVVGNPAQPMIEQQ